MQSIKKIKIRESIHFTTYEPSSLPRQRCQRMMDKKWPEGILKGNGSQDTTLRHIKGDAIRNVYPFGFFFVFHLAFVASPMDNTHTHTHTHTHTLDNKMPKEEFTVTQSYTHKRGN